MELETLINALREDMEKRFSFIPKVSKKGWTAKINGWICPSCGNGHGEGKTGIVEYQPNKFKCQVCGLSGDPLNLYQASKGLPDLKTAIQEAKREFGFNDDPQKIQKNAVAPRSPLPIQKKEPEKAKAVAPAAKKDFSEFFRLWQQANEADRGSYLEKRGISMKTQRRFKIGFVANPSEYKGEIPFSKYPLCVIPHSKNFFNARAIGSEVSKSERYRKPSGCNDELFNPLAFKEASGDGSQVFITEGEIDSLSFEECGFHAAAVGGAASGNSNNHKELIELLKSRIEVNTPIVIAFDNDEAGSDNALKLRNDLNEAGLMAYSVKLPEGVHDTNEFLIKNKEGFTKWASEWMESLDEDIGAVRDRYYNMNESFFEAYLQGMNKNIDTPAFSSGFKNLDRAIDEDGEGLYEGLYALAGATGTGKTAIALQMADQMAEAGHDVIYFSLEMPKKELIARILSKNSAKLAIAKDPSGLSKLSMAKTIRGITKASKRSEYSPEENALIVDSVSMLGNHIKHLFIRELDDSKITIHGIREEVAKHKKITGRSPIVFVDYFQLLADPEPPKGQRYDTRKAIDINVMGLKHISRDFHVPVFILSAVARDKYDRLKADEEDQDELDPVSKKKKKREEPDEGVYRDSSGIEYSVDVALVLINHGERFVVSGGQNIEVNGKKLKSKTIEVRILKNRSGEKTAKGSFGAMFNYYSAIHYYREKND